MDRVSIAAGGDGASAGARVREAIEKAFYLGSGRARAVRVDRDNGHLKALSTFDFDRRFNCSRCGAGFPEPVPALFSPNSPLGACAECEGFGRIVELDLDKAIPDPSLSLRQGLIAPWRTPAYREMHQQMLKCARRKRVRTGVPYREFSDDERAWLIDGETGPDEQDGERWPGVRGFFRWLERRRYKTHVRILLARYRRFVPCPACGGSKLKPEALNVRVNGRTIGEIGKFRCATWPRWIGELGEPAGASSESRDHPARAQRTAPAI